MKRLVLLSAVLLAVAAPAALGAQALDVSPAFLKFGKQPFGSFPMKSFAFTNTTSGSLVVSVEEVDVPDPFSPGLEGSTCGLGDTLLGPGESCALVVGFISNEAFPGRWAGSLRITARDEAGTVVFSRLVKMSGTAV